MLCIRSIPKLFSTVLFLGILDTSIASASPDNFFLNFDKDIRRSVLERRNRKNHRNGERVEAKEAVNNVLDEELQQGLFLHPIERYAKAVLVSTRHKLNEQYHRAFDDDAMTDISTTERKVRRKMKETRSKEDIELEKSAKMFEAYIEFDLE